MTLRFIVSEAHQLTQRTLKRGTWNVWSGIWRHVWLQVYDILKVTGLETPKTGVWGIQKQFSTSKVTVFSWKVWKISNSSVYSSTVSKNTSTSTHREHENDNMRQWCRVTCDRRTKACPQAGYCGMIGMRHRRCSKRRGEFLILKGSGNFVLAPAPIFARGLDLVSSVCSPWSLPSLPL